MSSMGYGGFASDLVSLCAVECDISVGNQRYHEGDLQIVRQIGDFTLQGRQNSTAQNGHDEQGRNLAFVNTRPFKRQRECVRPANRGKQSDRHDTPHRNLAADENCCQQQRYNGQGKNQQGASRLRLSKLEQQPAQAYERQVNLNTAQLATNASRQSENTDAPEPSCNASSGALFATQSSR